MVLVTFISLFFLANVHQNFGQEVLSPIVTVAQGQVQGSVKSTPEGRQFYAYQGIPFGKDTSGDRRFKAPEPAEPWTGVLQVTSDPPPCMQLSFNVLNPATGSEDCLQLNVYTPKLPTNESNPSLPVHVYIYGGAFITGNVDYHNKNPERYMNLDMVVVPIKYRLGPLGYLATNDEAASGNFGLLDQNLALQWVRDNIAAFGGNPNDVTLSGQSAGSASVIMQYQSPLSAGLFHRAIAESGSSLSPWPMIEDPLYYAQQMALHFNCSIDTNGELIECLREMPAEEIVAHSLDLMVKNLTLCFVPSIETSSSGKFITENPRTAFQNGRFNQVPLQLGFNKDEGVLVYQFIFFLFENITDFTFDVVIPTVVHVLTDYRQNLVNVSYAIKDEYYSDVDLEDQTEVNIATINMISDMFMKSGISETAVLVSSHNVTTYLYSYEYNSNHSSSRFTGEPDVVHGDELQYLWWSLILNDKDAEFQTRFFSLWTNFIMQGNHGTPSPSDNAWSATPAGQYNYFLIDDAFTMEGNYNTEKMDFWWKTVPAIVYG